MKKVLVVILVTLMFVTLGLSKTKIQFWHAMSAERIQLIASMAEDFMAQNPDIEVEVQYTGSYVDTLNKLIAAIKAGTPPNVVQVYEIGTRSMIDGEIAVPMQTMIDQDPTFDLAAFMPQVLNYYVVDGKLYSMPFNSSNAILFYNKDMFAAAGLDPENPPTTYEELIAAAKALTTKDDNGNIITSGITWPLHCWFFEQYLALQDAPLVNNDNGRTATATKSALNNEAGLKFLKLWKTLSDNDYMINTKKEDWSAARKLFVSQKVGMLITSTSDVTALNNDGRENGFEVGAAFLPTPKDSAKGGVVIGGGSLWMIDGNPEDELNATWEFVKFMAQSEQQIKWHKGTGYFPVRKDAVTDLLNSGYYGENPDHIVALMQLLFSKQDYNTNGAIMGVFPELRNTFEGNVEKMIAGEYTPEEVLEVTDRQLNELLEEYNQF